MFGHLKCFAGAWTQTSCGRPWFCARVCRRVDGKPKILYPTRLGSAGTILAAVRAAEFTDRPIEANVGQFGAPAALLALARRLQLADHIDRTLPSSAAAPIPAPILLVTALKRGRGLRPKACPAHWLPGRSGPRW